MTTDPYCGPAPAPSELWGAWNLDPVLLAVLGGLAIAFVLRPGNLRHRSLQTGAMAVLVVIFISPLCALATALFSARVLHHVLLVAVAAPVLLLALKVRPPAPHGGSLTMPFIAHTILLWMWHAPGPYAWALSGTGPYWIMELTLLGSALWLWRGLLAPGRNPGVVLATAIGTIMQMGFLGAILTFAKTPLYAAHLATTGPFGLSAVADQQLAGLIMWMPAALPYIALSVWVMPALFETARDEPDKAVPWPHG